MLLLSHNKGKQQRKAFYISILKTILRNTKNKLQEVKDYDKNIIYNRTKRQRHGATENRIPPEAKNIIANILLNQYNIFAFTMFECSGVYKMASTGNIIFENSIRVEIATDDELTAADAIIETLKKELNQESIMLEKETKEIYFK